MKNLLVAVFLTVGLSALAHAESVSTSTSPVYNCPTVATVVIIDSTSFHIEGSVTTPENGLQGQSFSMAAYSTKTVRMPAQKHSNGWIYRPTIEDNGGLTNEFQCSTAMPSQNGCPHAGVDAVAVVYQLSSKQLACRAYAQ